MAFVVTYGGNGKGRTILCKDGSLVPINGYVSDDQVRTFDDEQDALTRGGNRADVIDLS